MRERYPQTLSILILIAVFGCVIALAAIWHPFAYIFVGIAAVLVLAEAVRADRKHKP